MTTNVETIPTTTVHPNIAKWATISSSQMKANAVAAPPDLIDGLVPSQAVITFAGAPGIGKSMTTTSMAAAIALGEPWFGRKTMFPGQGLRVVYVLGEGWARFGKRLEAWEQVHDRALPEHLEFVNGASGGINLLDDADVAAAIAAFTDPAKVRPALIIFDTFAMLAKVKSENDNTDVGQVMANAHRLVAATGASVMLVHHVSKDEGKVRGASSFRGNADAVIVASMDSNSKGTFWLSTQIDDDGKMRDTEGIKLRGFSVASPGVLTHSSTAEKESKTVSGIEALMARPRTDLEPRDVVGEAIAGITNETTTEDAA